MVGLFSILRKHKVEIRILVSILGLLFLAAGFGVTWMQVELATRHIEASNVYQIQKDVRTLREKVYTPEYRSLLKVDSENATFVLDEGDASEKCCESGTVLLGESFQAATWEMFNFYLTVYRQGQYGMLPSQFLDDYGKDFCIFLKNKPVEIYWNSIASKYPVSEDGEEPDHDKMRKEWCDSP